MIEIEETGSGLYVTDAAKNELHIEMPDWREGGAQQPIDREVDEIISGYVSQVRIPQSVVLITTKGRNQWRTFGNESGTMEIEEGSHLIKVSTSVTVYIRLSGNFNISRNADRSKVTIDFNKNTAITIGIKSRIQRPSNTIVTPASPEKLGKAISHLSASIQTTSPDKSFPTLRDYPPKLVVGDTLEIPNEVETNTKKTGITITVPNQLDHIFVVAPLVYYLQAELRVGRDNQPMLEVENEDIRIQFSRGQEFEKEIVNLLRRVFWLDCVIRSVGPFGIDLEELKHLDEVSLDPDSVYSKTPSERLASYLSSNFEEIDSEFPEWHLATYVEPIHENIPTISHLLHRLSLIYYPRSRPAEKSELLNYSLRGFTRSARRRYSEQVSKAEPRFPEFQHGYVLGWIADGYPVGVFKGIPEAFEHKFEYLTSETGTKEIVVIMNDSKMAEERSVVSRKYQDRANDLSIELSIYDNVTVGKLQSMFESGADFIHYIGHCTKSGLLCQDGYLSTKSLDRSRVRTFFLNACGSFAQGKHLIEKGSVSGVVTRNRVLNRKATRVGSTFGKLIVHGFSIEQALRLAMMNTISNLEYFVIGDGTYTLTQSDDIHSNILYIETNRDDDYQVSNIKDRIRSVGTLSQPYISNSDHYSLAGNPITVEVNKEELISHLENNHEPVIFNDTYYWSDELSIKLRN